MKRSLRPCLAFVLSVAVALGGCSSRRDALTVYSGRDEALVGPLLERFSEQTGIAIDVRYGDSADLALLIAQEGERSPADVFFSQSPGPVSFLEQEQMLAELDRRLLAPVPPAFKDDRARWVGVSGRQRVLVYNREMVEKEDQPESVFELTAKQYAGKVALAPANASFQDFVSAMRALEGDSKTRAWLEGMAKNDAPAYPDNNSIVAAVGRGEIAMGLVNHYYNYRFLEEDPSLPSRNYVFPEGGAGSVVIAASVCVLERTERREEAERFVEFLLSKEAQAYFSEETFEYPLVSSVRPSPELPPLRSLHAPALDLDELGGDLRSTVRMIEASGLPR